MEYHHNLSTLADGENVVSPNSQRLFKSRPWFMQILARTKACIFKEEFRDINNFLSNEREKSSEQNGAKMMKIG